MPTKIWQYLLTETIWSDSTDCGFHNHRCENLLSNWLPVVLKTTFVITQKINWTCVDLRSSHGWNVDFDLLDIIPCSALKVNRRFGGKYRVQEGCKPAYIMLCRWFLDRRIQPWKWVHHAPPKRRSVPMSYVALYPWRQYSSNWIYVLNVFCIYEYPYLMKPCNWRSTPGAAI
jgi:hypothetical protein